MFDGYSLRFTARSETSQEAKGNLANKALAGYALKSA